MSLTNRHRLLTLLGCKDLTFAQQIEILTICFEEQQLLAHRYAALQGYASTAKTGLQSQTQQEVAPLLAGLEARPLAELCRAIAAQLDSEKRPLAGAAHVQRYMREGDLKHLASGLHAHANAQDMRQRIPDIDQRVSNLDVWQAQLFELRRQHSDALRDSPRYDARVIELALDHPQESVSYVLSGAEMPIKRGFFQTWLETDTRTAFEQARDELLLEHPSLHGQFVGFVSHRMLLAQQAEDCQRLDRQIQAEAGLCAGYKDFARAAIAPTQAVDKVAGLLAQYPKAGVAMAKTAQQPALAARLEQRQLEQDYLQKAEGQLGQWSEQLRPHPRHARMLKDAATSPDQSPLACPVAADAFIILSWLDAHDQVHETNRRQIAQRAPLQPPPTGLPLPALPKGASHQLERSLFNDLYYRMSKLHFYEDEYELGRGRERSFSHDR